MTIAKKGQLKKEWQGVPIYRTIYRNYLKKNIKKRECCVCGSKKRLEIHHKIPLDFGGIDILDNVVFLCERCHKELHEPVSKNRKLNPTRRWFLQRIGILRKEYRKKR